MISRRKILLLNLKQIKNIAKKLQIIVKFDFLAENWWSFLNPEYNYKCKIFNFNSRFIFQNSFQFFLDIFFMFQIYFE